ncbi:DUF924 family protein [Chromobacterium alticapitis]|uniref:DUF924 domain-containing protein n=1 Tax=Chromobacterium alticapitis TaxID=2073169 RepID=A0A2S5DES2_9NEIS|nr:DUF924 family protein [Chromobacterium alticapitis]POZ61554.1 DUF924 domain-containing protein [Chromobacterium alticapitis]
MAKLTAERVDAVLRFWFGGSDEACLNTARGAWFARDEAFDDAIRRQFLDDWQQLERGELDMDVTDAKAALAWLLIADQFPRNLFRGEARAFASDARARAGARLARESGLDRRLPPVARVFAYLPFEHSEDLADQQWSVQLFSELAAELPDSGYLDYARRHLDVIAEFGRFPHRNAALGRTSTAAELSYLARPGAGF